MSYGVKIARCLFIAHFVLVLLLVSNTDAQQLSEDVLRTFHYRAIGPTRQGGRIVDIAVADQEKQPYTFYVAAGPGGLWKTVNNGTTFEPVFDREPVLAMGDVDVAPSDPSIVWVGTGEASTVEFWGDGVYKSTDGGLTWTNMGLKETRYIGRIRIHPRNADIVYVAALGYAFSNTPERGVYKTTDGGRTWSKSLEVVVDGRYIGAVDLVMDPSDPETLYAATYERDCAATTDLLVICPQGSAESVGGMGSRIYKTTDGGESWVRLSNGIPERPLGRIGIDAYLRDAAVLYATIEEPSPTPGGPSVAGIYRSADGGASWARMGQARSAHGYFGQIRVDPNNPDIVYNFQSQMDKSTDGGRTWGTAFRFGGDWHAFWIDPENSNHMLGGYDYGFAMTYDGGESWYHADELPLAQLYAIGVDNDYPYNVYGGTQDFGTWKGPSLHKGGYPIRFEYWAHVGTHDGSYTQPDPTDSRWLYYEQQWGEFTRFDQEDGTKKRLKYAANPDVRFNFNAPILVSPHNSAVIYHGANMLLRSANRGEIWDEISPDLSNYDGEETIRGDHTITTVDQSPVDADVIWVGTDDGNLQRTRDGGRTWIKLNDNVPGNPEYWVSRVIASHHYAGTAYVTFNGPNAARDDFRPYVYKTLDFGETWTSISSNLPEGPINVIREDHKNPNLLFIGTDLGVFVTIDGGRNWEPLRNNMPAAAVHDLVIHRRENDLVVGTHGRGFFITDISPLQEMTPEVLSKDVHLFEIEPQVQWKMIEQTATSAQNFDGENAYQGVTINYYLSEEVDEEVKVTIYQGDMVLQEIIGSNAAGLNRALWGMTRRRERTEEEKEQYRSFIAAATGASPPLKSAQKGPGTVRAKGAWPIPHDSEAEYGKEYFDFYDILDWYGEETDAVSVTGRSLVTRRYVRVEELDPEFVYTRVRPGEYTATLTVGNTVLRQKVTILKDHWAKQ